MTTQDDKHPIEPKQDKYQLEGGGESGGGAYPNPHTGKEDKGGSKNGFMGHGGQTDIDYHGTGQLGSQDTGQGNANQPTHSEDDEPGR
jgi:hypothetical protein